MIAGGRPAVGGNGLGPGQRAVKLRRLRRGGGGDGGAGSDGGGGGRGGAGREGGGGGRGRAGSDGGGGGRGGAAVGTSAVRMPAVTLVHAPHVLLNRRCGLWRPGQRRHPRGHRFGKPVHGEKGVVGWGCGQWVVVGHKDKAHTKEVGVGAWRKTGRRGALESAVGTGLGVHKPTRWSRSHSRAYVPLRGLKRAS